MKCKCGNEDGKPLVTPRPILTTFRRELIPLLYMAGHDLSGNCWFCTFPRA